MVIVFDGVRKQYQGARGPALDGIDLTVEDGTILGLVGKNGAGKSTLLRLAAGLSLPTSGSIRVDGHDLRHEKVEASRSIGWVPETPRFEADERPASLLEHLARLDGRSKEEARRRASTVLERLGIGALAERPIRTLSQGQLRRLAIATAWLEEPSHLLYDEVTNGLDVEGRALWESSLTAVKQRGGVVILASHQLESVEAWADRIAVLQAGRLVAVVPGRARSSAGQRMVRIVVDLPDADRLAALRKFGTVTPGAAEAVLETEVEAGRDLSGELAREGFRVREMRSLRSDLARYLLDPQEP
jgi:ABC-2 type transport system ATP-binding protein